MAHWTLKDLESRTAPVEALVILSCDPMVYLAEVHDEGQVGSVLTNAGERCRTRSLEAMRSTLRKIPHRMAWLEHQSAFDEMIGLHSADSTRLRAPISIGDTDP